MKKSFGFLVLAILRMATADSIPLSGVVYDVGKKPLPGVVVTLAGTGATTTTDQKGFWKLLSGGARGAPRPQALTASGHLMLTGNRLRVVFDGRDLKGRKVPEAFVAKEMKVVAPRFLEGKDTLVYFFKGKVRLRDTVPGYGPNYTYRMIRILDTTINPNLTYGYLGFELNEIIRLAQIGNQLWMTDNVNSTGGTGNLGVCYNGDLDSCAKYGRLYAWSEVQSVVCPFGHVPSKEEWTTLQKYVDPTNKLSGMLLKTAGGWIPNGDQSGNGLDKVGFHGIPGGATLSNGSVGAGTSGYWWSRTESGGRYAWGVYMDRGRADMSIYYTAKDSKFSVRCVESAVNPAELSADSTLANILVSGGGVLSPAFSRNHFVYHDTVENAVTSVVVAAVLSDSTSSMEYSWSDGWRYDWNSLDVGTSQVQIKVTNRHGIDLYYYVYIHRKSAVEDTSTQIPWQENVEYGSVMDANGNSYKTVKIGVSEWMAENLNDAGSDGTTGSCYRDSAVNCLKYGRLYSWEEVMQGSPASGTIPSGVRGLCPVGWHVPSDAEWALMVRNTGDTLKAAQSLKAVHGWWSPNTNRDVLGFRALPGGARTFVGSDVQAGEMGSWWTATQSLEPLVDILEMDYLGPKVYRSSDGETTGHSLRCVKD